MNTAIWTDVCDARELIKGSGVAVRMGEAAVAVFLDPGGELHALAHEDPASSAEVIAWGILGELDGEWYVSSPLYKQKYRLRDGACIEGDAPDLEHWPARISEGRVEIGHGSVPLAGTYRGSVPGAALAV